MDGPGQHVAYPGNGTKGVGSCAQMGLGAQIFEAVPLFRDGVALGIIHSADHYDSGGLNLHRLALAFGDDQLPGCLHRTAGAQSQDFLLVVVQGVGYHGLYRIKMAAIVNREEGNTCFRVTLTAQPPPDGDRLPDQRVICKKGFYRQTRGHGISCSVVAVPGSALAGAADGTFYISSWVVSVHTRVPVRTRAIARHRLQDSPGKSLRPPAPVATCAWLKSGLPSICRS